MENVMWKVLVAFLAYFYIKDSMYYRKQIAWLEEDNKKEMTYLQFHKARQEYLENWGEAHYQEVSSLESKIRKLKGRRSKAKKRKRKK